jgi:hypothetical protein
MSKKRFGFGLKNLAAALLAVLLSAFAFAACGAPAAKSAASGTAAAATPGSGGITIVKSEITETASFIPYETNGTKMEVVAVKAPDGTIRTAFNTCQVCYDSGRGYYKQEGDVLVCQNCGNRFKISQVEKEKNGCNPVPILEGDKTDSGDTIAISADYLDRNKELFANWKTR